MYELFFFFSSRRRHTRWNCDWSSDVCSSDLTPLLRKDRDLGRRDFYKSSGVHRHGVSFRSRVPRRDRKSTRLNSSHSSISYAVFCLKKKNKTTRTVLSLIRKKTNKDN